MKIGRALVFAAALTLAACAEDGTPEFPGTVEWDRIELRAEASEPVVALHVREGETVQTGQILISLDTRRIDLERAQAEAERRRLAAQLDELLAGPRAERLREARALREAASSAERDAERERERLATLRERGLATVAELDHASARLEQAAAQRRATDAALDELLAGTRNETLRQAEAALAVAEANLAQIDYRRERLVVRAPRAGRVDALPFRSGDQPLAGATLVTLLAGDAPYARVFVPEHRRPQLAPGDAATATLESDGRTFRARLRWIASDPTFTPYFALTGDERARLVYLAEYELIGESLHTLPAGLAVRVRAEKP